MNATLLTLALAATSTPPIEAAGVDCALPELTAKSIIVTSGEVVRINGKMVECESLVIEEGGVLEYIDDLTIRATRRMSVDGIIRGLQGRVDAPALNLESGISISVSGTINGAEGLHGLYRPRSKDLLPQAASSLGSETDWWEDDVVGLLEASWSEADTANLLRGGDGGDVFLAAPLVDVNGCVRAGDGGNGGPSARGGDGGSVIVQSTASTTETADDDHEIVGGDGGHAGNATAVIWSHPIPTGGDGGNAICLRGRFASHPAWFVEFDDQYSEEAVGRVGAAGIDCLGGSGGDGASAVAVMGGAPPALQERVERRPTGRHGLILADSAGATGADGDDATGTPGVPDQADKGENGSDCGPNKDGLEGGSGGDGGLGVGGTGGTGGTGRSGCPTSEGKEGGVGGPGGMGTGGPGGNGGMGGTGYPSSAGCRGGMGGKGGDAGAGGDGVGGDAGKGGTGGNGCPPGAAGAPGRRGAAVGGTKGIVGPVGTGPLGNGPPGDPKSNGDQTVGGTLGVGANGTYCQSCAP